MSAAEQKSIPTIAGATVANQPPSNLESAVANDPELMKAGMDGIIRAYIGQRDEALAKAADLFSQLNVAEILVKRSTEAAAAAKADADDARKDLVLANDEIKRLMAAVPK